MVLICATSLLRRKHLCFSAWSDLLTPDSGFFAIRDDREAINQDDLNKAVRKVAESKKLEGKLEYQKL